MKGAIETYELEINNETHYILLKRHDGVCIITYNGQIMAYVTNTKYGYRVHNCGKTKERGVYFHSLATIIDIVADHIAMTVLGE